MSENNFSNDYTNLRLLHTSRYGNSRVFTANYNGKKVIVKTLKAECANNPDCKASLRQEFETTSMLENKYIRKALDFVQIEGLGDCIIFEYIEGKSLAEHVRVGTLTEKQVKSVLTEVCDALNYLHRNGMVHSNLNPENIMVTAAEGRAKLIDFGVPETKQDADRELLIKEMAFVAPEIIKGEDFDSRADVYSLGKIMEFIGERNITKQFSAVATHCTQFSKEQRYDTISDVRSAVSKGHSFVKIIILLVVAAVLAVLAFIYVPKISANVEKERSERRVVEFNRELENMKAELPELCKKYELKSIDEPVKVDWSDDSIRYANVLNQYLGHDETLYGFEDIHPKAMRFYQEQRAGIEKSRRADFDRLLLNEFKTSTDSIAVQMRSALVEPTDEALLIEATKWFGQRQ
ncbi:MAG: serine/threonine protein kinase [Bacteroidales bacterium]|nr:serine/threonine protein kinase [Bacteroidales bacterium]MBR6930839.1 serine/threonine protein kinase [Bacteroidales bacterium]